MTQAFLIKKWQLDGTNVPSHVGTLAPPGEYDWTCATFGPPQSTTQTANRSVQPFLHNSRQKVPILYNGRPFPQSCPFSWGSVPYLIMIPWASSSAQSKRHHDRFSRFRTGDHRVSLYFAMGRPFDPQNGPFPCISDAEVLENSNNPCSAVFA